MNVEVLENLLLLIKHIAATSFIGGALLLFFRGRDNRARRILSYNFLFYGLVFFLSLIFNTLEVCHLDFMELNILRPMNLCISNVLIVTLYAYPMELVLPGWIDLKKVLLILVPHFCLVAIYIIGSSLDGNGVGQYTDYRSFFSDIRYFNVWFRLTFIVLSFTYVFAFLKLIYSYKKRYDRWLNDNYASDTHMDVRWVSNFLISIDIICLSYMIMIWTYSLPFLILHNIVLVVVGVLLVYKSLFRESPYPEGFFSNTRNEERAAVSMDARNAVSSETVPGNVSDFSFKSKMPDYIRTFESWMEEQKPYLHNDFQLMDVAGVLPLNRSYLSRLFNEGYGCSFRILVRRYRLMYAMKLLVDEPSLTVGAVAEYSGFSSASSFIRTFLEEEGISPNQYRKQFIL